MVVEDREQVVSTAVSVRLPHPFFDHMISLSLTQAWGSQYAPLFESGRMSYRPRDFFESWDPLTLPDGKTINAPSVFMVRLVLHDWADDDSRK